MDIAIPLKVESVARATTAGGGMVDRLAEKGGAFDQKRMLPRATVANRPRVCKNTLGH